MKARELFLTGAAALGLQACADMRPRECDADEASVLQAAANFLHEDLQGVAAATQLEEKAETGNVQKVDDALWMADLTCGNEMGRKEGIYSDANVFTNQIVVAVGKLMEEAFANEGQASLIMRPDVVDLTTTLLPLDGLAPDEESLAEVCGATNENSISTIFQVMPIVTTDVVQALTGAAYDYAGVEDQSEMMPFAMRDWAYSGLVSEQGAFSVANRKACLDASSQAN